jgi:hypothetical protein
MPKETVGDKVTFYDADHAARTNSPTYEAARRTLMRSYGGGCFICDGPVDLSHPGVESSTGLQDHHGGGLYAVLGDRPVLVGLGLLQLEWSEGWGSDPGIVDGMVANADQVRARLGGDRYGKKIATSDDVMAYTDSVFNANVKLCGPHHIGHPAQDTTDARGHQAVGVHFVPLPVLLYQLSCDWRHWDMFAGTTGTIAVAPAPDRPGAARVLHVHPSHPDSKLVEAYGKGRQAVLSPDHPNARAAHRTDRYRDADHVPAGRRAPATTRTTSTRTTSTRTTTARKTTTPRKSTPRKTAATTGRATAAGRATTSGRTI